MNSGSTRTACWLNPPDIYMPYYMLFLWLYYILETKESRGTDDKHSYGCVFCV